MSKITYEDKEQLNTNENIPAKNKCMASDLTEIKKVVNENDTNALYNTNVKTTKTDSDTDVYSCNYVNEILTTKAGTVQKGAEIDNEHTNISLRKNGNIVSLQGVIYFSATKSKWTTFMTIPTDYNGVTGYGNLIEEATGKTYPVIVQNNGQVQCSVDITNANAYYYINIVYLI